MCWPVATINIITGLPLCLTMGRKVMDGYVVVEPVIQGPFKAVPICTLVTSLVSAVQYIPVMLAASTLCCPSILFNWVGTTMYLMYGMQGWGNNTAVMI